MARSASVLLIDDGELDLVRSMLDDLKIDYVSLRGSKAEPPFPKPDKLLVTTAPLAAELQLRRKRAERPRETPQAMWLAMVRGHTKMQRHTLRQAGFDMLIPESVHPGALLLILRRALFDGADTERGIRVAVGQEIVVATKLRRHNAILLDLSPSGCRLLTDRSLSPGTQLGLRLPVPDQSWLNLKGSVVRVGPGQPEGGKPNEDAVGVRFHAFKPSQKEKLKAILRERLAGPASLTRPVTPSTRGPETSPSVAKSTQEPVHVVYEEEVTAICDGATRALVGRDLCENGLEVRRNPHLRVGQRVRLALHGDRRQEPFLIEAHVERELEKGMWLKFDYMDSAARDRLVQLIRSLPKIHSFEEDTPTFTAVLAQLLGRPKASR